MRYLQLLLIFTVCLLPYSAYTGQLDFDNSILQVIVTYQKFDPYMPWQKKRPGTRIGYGMVIGDGKVITTEGLIRNHIIIELRRTNKGVKFAATLEQADHQANVALLNIVDKKEVAGMIPFTLANNIPVNASLKIMQFDEVGGLQYGDGQLIRISYDDLPYTYSSDYALTFNVLTDLNINRQGAAVIYDNDLVGITMDYDKSSRMGTVLPYPVLRHFIDDVATPPYKGFATAGFAWSALVDPAKRNFLKIPPNKKGILVLSVVSGSGASEVLMPEDVIMEWDGEAIDNLGFYMDRDFGRLLMPYMIRRRHPEDIIPLTVIRDGKKLSIKLKLAQHLDSNSLIPQNITGEKAEYIVDAGFVIRELNADYLFEHGRDWRVQNNVRLVHLYDTRKHFSHEENDRVVILSRVLPDIINVGYQNLRDEVITKINGQPVKNIKDIFRIVDTEGGIKRLTLQSIGLDLVIDQEKLSAANERIARLYQIPFLRYQR